MKRSLSYSEVSKALDCQAAWDFRYGDRLAGSSLKPKALAGGLSMGRAWGAAVAAYHVAATAMEAPGQLSLTEAVLSPEEAAYGAIAQSLHDDAEPQKEAGTWDCQWHLDAYLRLEELLRDYMLRARVIALSGLEFRYDVPIPSRSGLRRSSKYTLNAYVDGRSTEDGRPWLVEFKLRKQLMSVELIQRSRQIRWYAWAHWQATGEKVAGVLVDERLNEVPKPPKILKSGKVSTDKAQITTPEWYEYECRSRDQEPDADTLAAFGSRRWQQRVPVIFRDGELEEAGQELVSAAKLIGGLDSGDLFPVRNAKRSTCGYCDFADICDDPMSSAVDQLYDRAPAKRERKAKEKEVPVGT